MQVDDLTYPELLQLRVQVNNAIEQVESRARETLEAGGEVVGFRLKQGRKQRKISSEPVLVSALLSRGLAKKQLYDVKLKGIPALTKLCEQEGIPLNVLNRYIKKSRTKPTLEYTGE